MRIAVIGATGNIGRRAVEAIRRAGHDPVEISRRRGVDVMNGAGLSHALAGVDVVIDSTSTAATDRDATVEFFRTATTNILAAEVRNGVRHHVPLSIVGIDRVPGNAHYAGKRAQEALALQGEVPTTIVAATQFYDFPLTAASWVRQGDVIPVAPLLMQPIAPGDVADILIEVALGAPLGRLEIAGPEPQDLVDMTRRSFAARGEAVTLVPTWDGMFDVSMAGKVLLPGEGARIAPTTFDQWLAAGGATAAG
jgi:uncharacterized protein YbjT (DUF2867 family)